MKQYGNVVNVYKALIERKLSPGMSALDATCGNGNDTEGLCRLVGEEGTVYGIDIQASAVEATKQRLIECGLYHEGVHIINASHDQMCHMDLPLMDAVVFNLGYLPRGDKNITTESTTTVAAIEQALALLKNGGLLFVLCYRGHESGSKEYEILKANMYNLSQNEYDVMYIDFINQKKFPPVMWVVEKK